MRYVALLRGIAPTNPNMHQAKLCGVLERLGFGNVRGVISSGNVVFASRARNVPRLEATIEKAWPKELGFRSTTIVRTGPHGLAGPALRDGNHHAHVEDGATDPRADGLS